MQNFPLRKYLSGFGLLAILSGSAIAPLTLPLSASAQVRPVYDRGAVGLAQNLKRLQTTASALHTGAHPDDEDSGLLAYLARRENARTAYLSLNRGEGGQNIIGGELFEPLGVIRTEELLQARRLDGGQQFFTRVMDYGFSKTRAEAAQMWNEELVLGDMVRTIRMFRPLVVIARFTGTPADGHGQHQLAGYLTPIAFKAAADPNRFPEHFREGLRPWQVRKLYVSQSFRANAENVPTLTVNTGEYDPLLGRSYFEIAMEGRSQHKSQEMGTVEYRGNQRSGLRLVESFGAQMAKETNVFDGLDTTIKGIPALVGLKDDFIDGKLASIQDAAEKALFNFDALRPQKCVPYLADGLKTVREARAEIALPKNAAKDGARDADFLLQQKEKEFSDALTKALGIVADALADSETLVEGDKMNVAVRVFAPENPSVVFGNIELRTPNGWTAEQIAEPKPAQQSFFNIRETPSVSRFFSVAVPASGVSPSQPYWLESARRGYVFDWSAKDADANEPFQKSLMQATIKYRVNGTEVEIAQPLEYRYADEIRGEIRREVAVVPALSAAFESDLLIAPSAAKASVFQVTMSVTNNVARSISGALSLELPNGWTAAPKSVPFTLSKKGEKNAVTFALTIPAGTPADSYKITAQATADGKTFSRRMNTVAYPHIQTHRQYSQAEVTAKVVDLKVAPVRVGYVMGSGDRVPEAIRRLGLNVQMLDEKDLSTGNLSQFDVIVIGIRASQTRPDFVASNGRLLDFVQNGGTMIVQYQQPDYIQANLPPFPAKMDAVVNGEQRISNVRVTDENAPIKILVPNHAVFNFPNKITDKDWQNWIQERNLYSFSTFDEKYTPLLESHDEGEPESKGGMLYAELGKGKYVYTSYSFFRQLPVGNTGAYRLFANLLSLGARKTRK